MYVILDTDKVLLFESFAVTFVVPTTTLIVLVTSCPFDCKIPKSVFVVLSNLWTFATIVNVFPTTALSICNVSEIVAVDELDISFVFVSLFNAFVYPLI